MKKRTLSKKVVSSSDFLNLSVEAQALYFHLSVTADDDGFLNTTLSTARYCGIPIKTVDELVKNGYLIRFDRFVFCLTHWRVNNNKINPDRYKSTKYKYFHSLLIDRQGQPYQLKKEFSDKGA
ncbi:hypothetical protein [Liquorilactobacillus oeni]|uniref:Uncharacterized protein n=1 Tax=Liquorilactobacillus oeni DSM 19972 TaxID=1423777 RepID=A0A0R1MPS9_9LACO|nr:hypothetical protein [Liquorilactobacillus oeni]KRL05848.1 hypothetical protein FD46_GL000607 [Liquorilactobacillus oeni DSM 19972]